MIQLIKQSRLKQVFNIVSVNIILLLIILEVAGRIYATAKIQLSSHSQLLTTYYEWVNHGRTYTGGSSIENPIQTLSPEKIGIYGEYGCEIKKRKCKTVLLQGDSWAELLETHAAHIFVENTPSNFNFLMGGTSSFSPSNMSGQLGYLAKEEGKKIDTIIAFIDNTDIGDEYCRYRSHTILPKHEGEPVRVLPFTESKQFEHYAIPPVATTKSNSIHSLMLLKEARYRLVRFLALKYKIDFGKICKFEADIIEPVITDNKASIQYFNSVMLAYVHAADKLGIKKIVFFTHPHKRNLSGAENPFKTSASRIIAQFLNINSPAIDKMDIVVDHIPVYPPLGHESIPNYWRKDDAASHLGVNGSKFLAGKMSNSINNLNNAQRETKN